MLFCFFTGRVVTGNGISVFCRATAGYVQSCTSVQRVSGNKKAALPRQDCREASSGLRLPASTSHLERCSCLAGRGPNCSSLFPPLAAVVAVALAELCSVNTITRSVASVVHLSSASANLQLNNAKKSGNTLFPGFFYAPKFCLGCSVLMEFERKFMGL